ncbi:MAG: membrane protein insertase YidC [candidate division Zixibacteria bacterium]|nr:membrane protein insertase YidC [Candidatus Tariuqbacter arcticus]
MDKKTVFAFILIGIVVILMPYYYRTIMPEMEEQPQSFQKEDSISVGVERRIPARVEPEESILYEPEVVEKAHQLETETIDSAELEELYSVVETPLYVAKFSNYGAKLISFRLKEYNDRRGGFTEMIMKKTGSDEYYPNAYFTFPGNNNLSTDALVFSINSAMMSIEHGDEYDLVFTKRFNNGGLIRCIYTFEGGTYRLRLKVESEGIKLDDDYYFRWDGGVNVTEIDTLQDLTYSKAFALMGGELEKFDAPGKYMDRNGRIVEKRMRPSGTVDWIAVRSKYFEIAAIPQGNTAGIDFVSSRTSSGKNASKEFKLALRMRNPGGKLNQDFTLYIGPIDSKRLSSLGVGLEATMNWGWVIIKPFSKFVLWSFKLLHKVIPNYGVVIVVFSILIKIILWPLTHKSYESMRRMQKLQPLMKELKEKHKGDPQRMQKETAKLYKEHSVNPMGGCLPMLLQMPLLYALFIVFRSTIELRDAPFMLWIQDLSMPDTVLQLGFTIPMYGSHVSVLPLVMGISTYFQSKSTIADPSQKMMLYFMPIFLTLIFNNFPSGLTLYYTLFNIFSVVQQRMLRDKKLDENKQVKSAKGKK